MIPIDWKNLRSINGSQQEAFELLCCQLAEYEAPKDAKFCRKAPPDAGVECFTTLSDGNEWGWQAKFFSKIGKSQWKQLDDSVSTALAKHPKLTRYIICIPQDRQDPRDPNKKYFMDQWNEQEIKWKKLAFSKGMKVDFDYWGSYEIIERLSRSEHRGRIFFWFGKELFDSQWFQAQLNEAKAAAGPRYTPEIHVDLPIAQLFEALGRTNHFSNNIKTRYREIKNEIDHMQSLSKGIKKYKIDGHLEEKISTLLDKLLTVAANLTEEIDWSLIADTVEKIIFQVDNYKEKIKTTKSAENLESSIYDRKDSILYHISRFRMHLRNLNQYCISDDAKLSNISALLLSGGAGKGKTHLFCDVANKRVESGFPTILLMGQSFTSLDEPWTQIIRLLKLPSSTTATEFLGVLEAAAQAANTKALIMIDALNEGMGKSLWKNHIAAFLETISHYKWISIAMSIRSSYKDFVIPSSSSNRFITTEHHGFAENEYQATQTFFSYYDLALPSAPLLMPEFQTPLFLKIVCQGLKNSKKRSFPRGLHGITNIFHLFLDEINIKLSSEEFLGFNSKKNIVHESVSRLAESMSNKRQDWLFLDDAECVLEKILSKPDYQRSLYFNLLSEGVLVEDVIFKDNKWLNIVRFGYEKFSDHFIIANLLDKYLNVEKPETSFSSGTYLGEVVTDKRRQNAGLIEALCIQIPERLSKELPEIAVDMPEDNVVISAFFESLIWRNPKAINISTKRFLNKYSGYSQELFEQSLNVLLTVATLSEHPYNMDFLHNKLKNYNMAERDAWWSIFLHNQVGCRTAVDRVIDWAWSKGNKSYIDDEAIRLCGVCLAWFFTTSNRFLRDRATKALVNLCTNRLLILDQIIRTFRDIDDLYIQERLYAVAYGCVLRSTSNDEIAVIAQTVYDLIFKEGNPPVHVLLRCYASGVIEYVSYREIQLNIDLSKIKPPYYSKWPDIPTKEEIDAYKIESASYEGSGAAFWGQNRIFNSVLSDDFGRYVIGTNSSVYSSSWLSHRLNELKFKSPQQILSEFVNSLTPKQKSKWLKFDLALKSYIFNSTRIILTSWKNEEISAGNDVTDLDEEILKLEADKTDIRALNREAELTKTNFKNSLSRKKLEIFEKIISPILSNPYRAEEGNWFDLSQVQRWIVKRVFDLGWTVDRFNYFDRYYIGYEGREAKKAERIGKKYQWIAYYEFLAYLSDNFQYNRKYLETSTPQKYHGTWQLGIRDIDPSCIIKETKDESRYDSTSYSWWHPITYNSWRNHQDDVAWLKDEKDLPNIKSFLNVRNPNENTEWFTLDGFYRWEEPTPPEMKHYDRTTRNIWYFIRSYIVHKSDIEHIFKWAKTQSFFGRWMPEPFEIHEAFLGELYWSPASSYEHAEYDYWSNGDKIPRPIHITTEIYHSEKGAFDCSHSESFRIKVPTKIIIDKMQLRSNGKEGYFYNNQGSFIFFDPSVNEKGQSVLLARREYFLKFLEDNDYSILWTVLGGKGLIGGNIGDGEWEGEMEINGAFTVRNGLIEGEITPKFRCNR